MTTTKERPINFGAPMIRKLLAGQKTQSRRVCKLPSDGLQDVCRIFNPDAGREFWRFSLSMDGATQCYDVDCPYGVPGSRLYVKEAAYIAPPNFCDPADANTRDDRGRPRVISYAATMDGEAVRCAEDYGVKKTSPIFLPRWASRITLELTAVRVERLQSISEADAVAEGFSDLDLCAQVFRQAAGKARMEFGRWLELPDGSEPDGDWCVDCVEKEAKKRKATIQGWNDCPESDHAPRCEKCGVMLHHSLTRYGIHTELDLTDEDRTRAKYTPAEDDQALCLAELCAGMGDWHGEEDEYAGRLAQKAFGTLWDAINGKRPGCAWADSPWVWCLSFRRVEEGGCP